MPIKFIEGNIFDAQVEALVNPVNCEGVMGKGLALQFKQRYPRMFSQYRNCCAQGILKPGQVLPHINLDGNPNWILCAATKNKWRSRSHVKWVSDNVRNLAYLIKKLEINSIAVPALGCGEGGLAWQDVLPMFSWWRYSPAEILIYKPLEE